MEGIWVYMGSSFAVKGIRNLLGIPRFPVRVYHLEDCLKEIKIWSNPRDDYCRELQHYIHLVTIIIFNPKQNKFDIDKRN